jgi:hypothetical protein
MPKSPTTLAHNLLSLDHARMEDLEIHRFKDGREAHDDEAIRRLYSDFESKIERAQSELSASYGMPIRMGNNGDKDIPIAGVRRFAVWEVGTKLLYLAFAHEDRGAPILLILGAGLR